MGFIYFLILAIGKTLEYDTFNNASAAELTQLGQGVPAFSLIIPLMMKSF